MRLFFAIWPPRETAAALAAWAGQAQREVGGNVARAETIHLTLAFLGEVPGARAAAAFRAARGMRGVPHALPIEEARLWPHNHIVWVGPRETPAALGALAASLRAELESGGFAIERRPFAAHVTLIRKARATGALPPLPSVEWPVNEVALMRSTLAPQGPSYEVMERMSLRG